MIKMDKSKEELFRIIDLFLQELNNEFSQYEHLQSNNSYLQNQIDTVIDENKKYKEVIELKNESINKLLEENMTLNKYQSEFLNDLKNDFISQVQVVEMKYQVIIVKF